MKKDKTPKGQDKPRERVQVLVSAESKTLLKMLAAKRYCTQQQLIMSLIADAAQAAGLMPKTTEQ